MGLLARRKTNEEFVKEVYDLVGDEYTFLEEYIGNKTKIKCMHNKCGYKYAVRPDNFLSGNGCPQCNGGIRKSRKAVINDINQKLKSNIYKGWNLIVGEEDKYKNRHSPLLFRHKDGYIVPKSYSGIIKESHFMLFNMAYPEWSLYNIKLMIKNKNIKYTIKNNAVYKGTNLKHKFICPQHGEFEAVVYNILQGDIACNKCWQIELSKPPLNKIDTKEAIKIFKEKGYEVIDTNGYSSIYDKMVIKDTEGYKYLGILNNVKNSNSKPFKFSIDNPYTIDNIKEIWMPKNAVNCELLTKKWTGNTMKLKLQCKSCQKNFHIQASNFLFRDNYRVICPHCEISKGETRIGEFLDVYDIIYKKQYKFNDCRSTKGKNQRFPFDFAVFNQKNKLQFLIEYDGEQHFTGWHYNKKSLDSIQQNDQIKNQYCKDHNIPLLRIPYWEFDNIETILEEWLTEHGVLNQ